MKTTAQIHKKIETSNLFRLDGEAIDLPAALESLAAAILAEDETDWNIGEYGSAPLDSLIPAAYWTLCDWHAGQASPEYAALCQLSRIYTPGPCAKGPEPETMESDIANALEKYYKKD